MTQMNDTDLAALLKITDSSGEAPLIEDLVFEMYRVVKACQEQQTNRTDFEAFHTRQKIAVSSQAAQQKALQMYLKRRMRKLTARILEVYRSEEETLVTASYQNQSKVVILPSGDQKPDPPPTATK